MDDIRGEATINRRGQLTISKKLRDALFLTEGSRVMFQMKDDEIIIAAACAPSDSLDKWFGRYPLHSAAGDIMDYVRDMRGWENEEIDL